MPCSLNHTKYQPEDYGDSFSCPKCGASEGDFYIDHDDIEERECDKVHTTDKLFCFECGYQTNGVAYSTMMLRRKAANESSS